MATHQCYIHPRAQIQILEQEISRDSSKNLFCLVLFTIGPKTPFDKKNQNHVKIKICNNRKRKVQDVTFDKWGLGEHSRQSRPYINAAIGKFSHLSIIPSKYQCGRKRMNNIALVHVEDRSTHMLFSMFNISIFVDICFVFPLYLCETFLFCGAGLLFYSGDRHLSS